MAKMELPNYIELWNNEKQENKKLREEIALLKDARPAEFAIAAMQGLLAFHGHQANPQWIKEQACFYADALIAELDKRKQEGGNG